MSKEIKKETRGQLSQKIMTLADYFSSARTLMAGQEVGQAKNSTLRRHRDPMWMLGGEGIRRLNGAPSLRREPVEKVIFDLLEEEGGLLIWPQLSELQQDAFDASCRKFHRFLQAALDKDKTPN